MRILYLAHRIPYPPNKGDKIRSYHHLRHLATRHTVHLFSFVHDAQDEEAGDALRQLCHEVELLRLRAPQALCRGTLSLVGGRSLSEGYFGVPAMRRAVRRALGAHRFDVAWAFSSVMADYLRNADVPTRVVDIIDVDSEKWRQYADHSHAPLRWAYRLEAQRLRAFEARIGQWADRVLFVSAIEAALFRSFCPQARDVRVIVNGVDTEYFRAPADDVEQRPPRILFTGALDYRPNVEAVLYFSRQVLPLVRQHVPDARFVAVGHRPTARLLREVEHHGGALEVAGSVPDVRPYFQAARVYVAPLQLGTGLQNKLLEAMAMRVPIVTTSLALAGLEATPGTHVLVANSPTLFAAAVCEILHDPDRSRSLVHAAARLIEQHYSWEAKLQQVDACLERTASGQTPENAWTACSA